MAQPDTRAGEAERILERLARLDTERAELEQRLAELAGTRLPGPETARHRGQIANRSPTRDKIALFRSLFAGREDVYPKRWENAGKGKAGYAPVCANEWQRGVCHKPRVRCGACPNQAFVPITDEAVEGHLRGRHTLGVYPMLADDTCRFLAAGFDKETWRRDAGAYLAACRAKRVPAALERSRSGNGAHVWFFFEEPVAASLARRLGAHILTEAMERNPDIGFRSYDRFFPSQDTLRQGGFGNLIALPLQGGPRESGNSVFLDADFEPWPDQWSFLSGLQRLSAAELATIVDEAGRRGRIVGLRLPLDDEDEGPWTAPPSRRRPLPAIAGAPPGSAGRTQRGLRQFSRGVAGGVWVGSGKGELHPEVDVGRLRLRPGCLLVLGLAVPEPPAPLTGFSLDPQLVVSVAVDCGTAIHRVRGACHVIARSRTGCNARTGRS